jgi:hypothetical protein
MTPPSQPTYRVTIKRVDNVWRYRTTVVRLSDNKRYDLDSDTKFYARYWAWKKRKWGFRSDDRSKARKNQEWTYEV